MSHYTSKQSRIGLSLALGVLVLALVLSSLAYLLVLVLFIYSLPPVRSAVVRSPKRFFAVWSFILLGALPLLIGRSDTEAMLIWWHGWGISFSTATLFARIVLRASLAFGAMTLLIETNPIYLLCQRMRNWGIPMLLIELIELSYRYIHILLDTSSQMREAQLCRLGYATMRSKLEHGGMLFAQSFVLAHSNAEQMYDGLLSRQFDTEPQPTPLPNDAMNNDYAQPILELRNIRYSYHTNQFPALQNLSLRVYPGERIALLGANGAGKSTLMRLVSGLIREDVGEIFIHGISIGQTQTEIRAQRKRIALVMQNANHQLFAPSVEDEIAFGLRNIGLSTEEVKARVSSIIACYELETLRHIPPHQLSEGQKKWVSIASIMALEPEIILLDEPTATLDCYYTDRVMTLLNELSAGGRTIILSTHDMNLAYSWAERTLVLANGQLIYDGDLEMLYADNTLVTEAKLRKPYGYTPRRASSKPRSGNKDYRLGLFHDVNEMPCLIIGGGKGALRKTKTLLSAGAICTIISPDLCQELRELHLAGQIIWHDTPYQCHTCTLEPYTIVVAATGDVEIDRDICMQAMAQNILAVSLSDPSLSTVQFAAQGQSQGISIAVHTDFALPEVAQAIRDQAIPNDIPDLEIRLNRLSELRRTAPESMEYEHLRTEILTLLDRNRTAQ